METNNFNENNEQTANRTVGENDNRQKYWETICESRRYSQNADDAPYPAYCDGNSAAFDSTTSNAERLDAEKRAAETRRLAVGYRLGYLLFALCFLIGLALLPSLAERISYSSTKGAERAKREEAAKFLRENPNSGATTRIPFVAKLAAPSVVGVKTDVVKSDMYGSPVYAQGQGSGVVVDKGGFIVTNFHVICEDGALADGVQIILSDGRTISNGIRLVGFDEKLDVAVLKIDATDLTPIAWGNSDALEVGDAVLALGNPYGLAKTVTEGIVSAKERFIFDERGVASQEFLQTDAAVNPGNSGGALVNDRGELVGINTAIYGQQYQGISFALPSKLVRQVYDAVLKQYRNQNQ